MQAPCGRAGRLVLVGCEHKKRAGDRSPAQHHLQGGITFEIEDARPIHVMRACNGKEPKLVSAEAACQVLTGCAPWVWSLHAVEPMPGQSEAGRAHQWRGHHAKTPTQKPAGYAATEERRVVTEITGERDRLSAATDKAQAELARLRGLPWCRRLFRLG
jgi:hypothetical protein